ncbi:MAG: hypothetical protein ABIJ34_09200 [archaeon]
MRKIILRTPKLVDTSDPVYWLLQDSKEGRLLETIGDSLKNLPVDLGRIVQVGPSPITAIEIRKLLPKIKIYGIQYDSFEFEKVTATTGLENIYRGDGYLLHSELQRLGLPQTVDGVLFENNLAMAIYHGMCLERVKEILNSCSKVVRPGGWIGILGHSSYVVLTKQVSDFSVGDYKIYSGPAQQYMGSLFSAAGIDTYGIRVIPERDPRITHVMHLDK